MRLLSVLLGFFVAIPVMLVLIAAAWKHERSMARVEEPFSRDTQHEIAERHPGSGLVPVPKQGGTPGPTREQVTPVPAAAQAFHFAPMVKYQSIRDDIDAYYDYEAVLIGDITGDDRDDLVALPIHNTIRVFAQTTDGRLRAPWEWNYANDVYSHPKEAVLGDFNSDAIKDVAFLSITEEWPSPRLSLLLSNGRGGLALRHTSTAPTVVSLDGGAGEALQNWTTFDVDLDGNLDIVGFGLARVPYDQDPMMVCGTQGTDCPQHRILFGNGKGGFERSDVIHLAFPSTPWGAIARDLNVDGYTDLAFSLSSTMDQPGKVMVQYHNRVSGLRPLAKLHDGEPAGTYAPGTVFGKFNANATFSTWKAGLIYPRRESGTYQQPSVVPTTGYPRSYWPLAKDIDGDRHDDLVSIQMVPQGGGFSVHLALNRQVNGRLQAPELTDPYSELDKGSYHMLGLAAGDLNSDRCQDVVVAAGNGGLLRFDGVDCAQSNPPLPRESRFKSRR